MKPHAPVEPIGSTLGRGIGERMRARRSQEGCNTSLPLPARSPATVANARQTNPPAMSDLSDLSYPGLEGSLTAFPVRSIHLQDRSRPSWSLWAGRPYRMRAAPDTARPYYPPTQALVQPHAAQEPP